jgi:hypothetical protein
LPGSAEQRLEYFASNAFDHGVVSERTNYWLMRAWSGSERKRVINNLAFVSKAYFESFA